MAPNLEKVCQNTSTGKRFKGTPYHKLDANENISLLSNGTGHFKHASCYDSIVMHRTNEDKTKWRPIWREHSSTALCERLLQDALDFQIVFKSVSFK